MDLSATTWRKSSYSTGGGEQCVEVAVVPGAVAIRDSKDPHGPAHVIPREAFRRLITRIRHER
jgi:Domain of unknown function (DUF397)